jgi:hypothetical protein
MSIQAWFLHRALLSDCERARAEMAIIQSDLLAAILRSTNASASHLS